MDREEAVTVIKEIFERCRFIEGRSLKLLPPKENNALSDTFQVHIDAREDGLLISCITNVAKKHKLDVRCEKGYCIVYKPYPRIIKST